MGFSLRFRWGVIIMWYLFLGFIKSYIYVYILCFLGNNNKIIYGGIVILNIERIKVWIR